MFNNRFIVLLTVAVSFLSVSEQVLGRERWLERDNKPILLHPRRFGQENPDVLSKLRSACDGGVCATLAGQAISTLLAAAGECNQQDMADQIIDAAQQFDDATKQSMIDLAVEFRQVEKNTPPDFTTNPPTNRNSVFCQKAPANAELDGLVQAQDPANDPNIFFDPATKTSVTKGSQANTFPFDTDDSSASDASADDSAPSSVDASVPAATGVSAIATDASDEDANCDTSVVTVTVSARDNAATAATDAAATTADTTATGTAASTTAAASDIGDFGSCSVPQIEFATGFDNRKETSFQPVDQTSFNHGSAQNIDIITQFICDTLTNSCGADQTAKDTCQTAKAAASAQTAKTGAQADAFNAAFGITTAFASVAEVDNQGNIVAGSTSGAASDSADADASATAAATDAEASATTGAAGASNTAVTSSTSSDIGDFGSCSVPQIEFATGFDNRKETSFQPADKASFNHGSAQAIGIITQFICDTLTNSCGADQTAKDTCATATAAANAQTAKTGAQADAFNAAFGITTNFASVAAVDDQGNVVSGTGSGNDAASPTVAAATTPSSDAAAATATAAADGGDSTSTGGNLQTFTGNLGASAPAVTALSDGEFQVDGNASFKTLQNALVRSCDVQHNQCANAANASGNKGDLTVAACGDQQQDCNTQARSAAA